MSNLVKTRVLEICEGKRVVQFENDLNSWATFSDTFTSQAEAEAWEQNQIDSADLGD